MSYDQIVEEIGKLSPAERAGLVDLLIEGMPHEIDLEIERAHLDEVARRRCGPGEFVPGEEVFREARKIVGL